MNPDDPNRARVTPGERSTEITRVVREVIRQRRSGVEVHDAALVQRFKHLMPELGERLHTLQMIEAAKHAAKDRATDAEAPDGTDAALGEDVGFLREALPEYEILERIHEGGQGVVYKAVQRATNRIAAVKVLLHGPLATEQQRQRFTREVELVARLRHPNIVTLYESGVVRGRPYFAMEYIEGIPIDDYVLLHNLSTRQSAELFITVCRAVSSAHQYGIIHRDLKPSNILVDLDGQPHVLDFGLAKDLVEPLDAHSGPLVSMTGQVVGTLPYLSPEQAAGRDTLIDVRSDIYSLGVVFHELLTETFPYPVDGDREAVRINIMAREPLPLRKALAAADGDGQAIARQVDGDLEAIVLKTLAKEPENRYQSVAAMAQDLERWLAGEVVEAKADRRFYLLKKTLRRYRVHAAISAAFVALLVGALVGMTILWQRTERIARTAQAGLEMGSFLRLGSVYRDDERLDQAVGMLQKAIEIGESAPQGDETVRRLQCMAHRDLAALYYQKGQSDAADPHCRAAVELADQLLREDPDNLQYQRLFALSHELRGQMARSNDEWEDAARHFTAAESGYRDLISADPENRRLRYELALLLLRSGRCCQSLERYEEARRRFDAARDILHELAASEPHVAEYVIDLAKAEASLAVWHMHQDTVLDDQAAFEWFKKAEDRVLALRDSGRAAGHEPQIDSLLDQIRRNKAGMAARATNRAKNEDRHE
ncbi:MAG TPA: protein kinase [Phycisphaerae bacterium]|nr:protein kinase [Phycisphaerae bacterium]